MSDPKNTHGTPGADEEADTASGGAPQDTGAGDVDPNLRTDDNDKPVDNPTGG